MTLENEPHYSTGNIAAFVICHGLPQTDDLRVILDARDPTILAGAEILASSATALEAQKGNFGIALMAIDSPYPDKELEAYCQTDISSSNPWDSLSGCAAHVAIVIRVPAGSPPPRDAVLLTGRIAIALEGAGIIWSAADAAMTAPEFSMFFDRAEQASSWPVEAVISITKTHHGEELLLQTKGLSLFSAREITMPLRPSEIEANVTQLRDICRTLLVTGQRLDDTTSTVVGVDDLRLESVTLEDGTTVMTVSQADEASPEQDASAPSQTSIGGDEPRKVRAKILHKPQKVAEASTDHRSREQRNKSKHRADPRETIEGTLAAIRAAQQSAANEEPEKTHPRWMFWKK